MYHRNKKYRLNFRCDKELHSWLCSESDRTGINMSDLIRSILKYYERYGGKAYYAHDKTYCNY